MTPFLKALADGYSAHYASPRPEGMQSIVDLSEFCFVFPNKRAGAFFTKYLAQSMEDFGIAPKVTTITDFVEEVSGATIDSRLDLIFELYNSYRDLILEKIGPDAEIPTFEGFRIWGETALRDFSDVDMHNVDAAAIFKNVKDFRELSTDFMTEEQAAVSEEYFGRTPTVEAERFWRQFADIDEEGNIDPGSPRIKFMRLWQVFAPLHKIFNERLAARGLATPGGAYRLALRRIQEDEWQSPYKKIIFAGFNALGGSERAIFKALSLRRSNYFGMEEEPIADFVWDFTGPALKDVDNPAGRFVTFNRKRLPEPEWLRPQLREAAADGFPPHLEIISCPSNTYQAKIGGNEILRLMESLGKDTFDDARVALVVPDETLLLPLLYSLPKDIGEPNLTMGYPLKMTSVATFMQLLRKLQTHQRRSQAGYGFAIDELVRVLNHPLMHVAVSTRTVAKFKNDLAERRRLIVTAADIAALPESGRKILQIIESSASCEEVAQYLDTVLSTLSEEIGRQDTTMIKARFERAHIETWRDALSRLLATISRHNIKLTPTSFLYESERLLSAEIVPFEGEPLKGLQVMGLLETRLLDFDHIVMLSLNDRIMPRRYRQRTFIPDAVRVGFEMPPANYQEDIFAYYFYRLISRAKSVRLVYDARIGVSGGGPSRYLRQLEYIYKPESLIFTERKFEISNINSEMRESGTLSRGRKRLHQFLIQDNPQGEGHKEQKYLSASALKKYAECPRRFYLEVLCGLRSDTDRPIYDSIDMGQTVHYIMQNIYLPDPATHKRWLGEKPIVVTKDYIRKHIEDIPALDTLIRRAINKEIHHLPEPRLDDDLPASARVIASALRIEIIDILSHDLKLAPFELLGAEYNITIPYRCEGVGDIEMIAVFDRIDRIKDSEGVERMRIVDYKTGSSIANPKDFEDIFVNMAYNDHSLQMLIYAELLSRHMKSKNLMSPVPDLRMTLYHTPKMKNGEHDVPMIGKEAAPMYSQIREQFRKRIGMMLREIFDPDNQFEPTGGDCTYCYFKNACQVRKP